MNFHPVTGPHQNILGFLHYFAGDYVAASQALLKNQRRGGPIGPGQLQLLAATHFRLGDIAGAESSLAMAEGLRDEVGRSENWLLGAFRNPEVPQKLFDDIVAICTQAGIPCHLP